MTLNISTKKNDLTVIMSECILKTQSIKIRTATPLLMREFLEKLSIVLEVPFEALKDLIPKQTKNVPSKSRTTIPKIKNNEFIYSICEIDFNIRANDDLFKDIQSIFPKGITRKTKSTWYPNRSINLKPNKECYWKDDVLPKYPIYVLSLGRYIPRKTVKYLEFAGLPYKIVVEPFEYLKYAQVINPNNILTLPEDFSKTLKQGGIPARNFILEHARSQNSIKHWILDDNIQSYMRLYQNERIPVCGGSPFREVEDFVDNHTNIMLAAHQYVHFKPPLSVNVAEYSLNTRAYSSILIDNKIKYSWRGKYNEDTDLSLRVLKDGNPIVLFNSFLADKEETGSCKGGNTTSIYTDDGFKLKAESLKEQHPDVTEIVTKFKRTHHVVNYKPFKNNKLISKDIIEPKADYKLRLVSCSDCPEFAYKSR